MEPLSYFALMLSGVDPSVVLGYVQIKQEVEESFRREYEMRQPPIEQRIGLSP